MRWLMISFGVAAAVLAVLAVLWPRVAPTTYLDLLPLPGDRAVLLREDRDSQHPQWLETVGQNESRVRLPFYAQPPINMRDASSLVTAGPAIVVRDELGGIAGFDVLTLRERWNTSRLPGQVDPRGEGFALPLLDSLGTPDTLVEFWGQGESWALVVASDPATGRERWRREFHDLYSGPAEIRGDTLALFEEPGLELFDLRTGATRARVDGAKAGCFAGDYALYRVPTGRDSGEVHLRSLATGKDVAVSPALSADPFPTGACFWHAGTVAAILRPSTGARSDLVVYDAATGVERHRVELPGTATTSLDPWYRGTYAVNDADVRFAPVLLFADDEHRRALILDLEQGTVATIGSPFASITASVAADQGRYYLWSRLPAAIAVLDGATGKLVAQTCLPDYTRARFHGGRAWVFDSKKWALLDGATLKPINGELAATACAQPMFGLP